MWCWRSSRPRRVPDELAQHGGLGVQLDQRELDALVGRQRLAPRDALVGVGHGLVDAELRGAERRRRLADAVLVHEVLGQLEAVVDPAEHRRRPTRTSCSVTSAWSVGMLNVHQKKSTLKPGASVGTRKAVMPTGAPGSPDVRAKTMSWVAWCRPGVEPLLPVDDPLVAVGHRRGLEVGGVGAVVGLGEPEGQPARAVEEARHPLGPLLVGAEVAHHQHGREVADDRALVLQVVVQAEALGRPGARG